MASALLILVSLVAAYQACAYVYFRSDRFNLVRDSVGAYIENCNQLNAHIDHLKSAYVDVSKVDLGNANLIDNSVYNMRRRRWAEIRQGPSVYNCSATVVKSATDQPFKYLCKYFNIQADEGSLDQFEGVLNDFAAAEQGRALLVKERSAIVKGVHASLPFLISIFSSKRVIGELGFDHIDLSNLHFPVYIFQYVSAGGNSSSKCIVQLDVNNLDRLVTFLHGLIRFRKTVAGQRALMTSKLRELIKSRDGFTCKICNLSINDERNLLLEVDHVVPLSKGGITSEDNLQTLCWKCNRSKGAKLGFITKSTTQPVHAARLSGQQVLY